MLLMRAARSRADENPSAVRSMPTSLRAPEAVLPNTLAGGAGSCQPQRKERTLSSFERLDSLKARHAGLEAQIAEEERRPHPDDVVIHHLKKLKLRIKDELLQSAHAE